MIADKVRYVQPDRAELVRVESISFGHDPERPPVLEDVSFEIRRGEVLTLLGPSGCGKSTCLNLVAGLASPWQGRVHFRGAPVTGVNTAVGYMTQEDTLLPWKKVRSNIALALKLGGQSTSRDSVRVDEYLALLNLSDAGDKFPSQLSGGMKRRALLARSLICEPELVLMDEPFAAIDADLREELQSELRRMTDKLHQTVLFVTHDVAEAALISDRVIVFGGHGTSRIRGIVEVPFGKDRDLNLLRASDDYFHVQQEIRELLRGSAKTHLLPGSEA